MVIGISKITSVMSKISDLTAGDKSIPGVLLNLQSDGVLEVCYSDGHKSLIEKLNVELEDTDKIGGVVVDFNQLKRIIDNGQPSGKIKVDKVRFVYQENVIRVEIDQIFEQLDENGDVASALTMAGMKMDIRWVEPGSDMKSSILTRMKYDDIFNTTTYDTIDRKEIIDFLSRTSVEKGKQIYMSNKTQSVFVANTAHMTCVPISRLEELSLEDKDTLRAEMVEAGTFTDEAFEQKVKEKTNRLSYSAVIPRDIAKAITGILSKASAEKVNLWVNEKYCNIFIDTEDEILGIWFEMAQASKAHLGTLERYNSYSYETYQLMFMREFLNNAVKCAINSTKNDKITVKFEQPEEQGVTSMVLLAGSASASTSDKYSVIIESKYDSIGDLKDKQFNLSLKVMSDMLAQLKTDRVSMDFAATPDGSYCLRMAEINPVRLKEEFDKGRLKTEEDYKALGKEFDASSTPTSDKYKLEMRANSIDTKQYTMLGR